MALVTETDLSFRAIGRYVYEFSWLCWDMKQALSSVPGLIGKGYTTIELIAGEMTAAPLANACFAICEDAVRSAPTEVKMIRALRSVILEEISRRNDFMHGDWMIGWVESVGTDRVDGTVEHVVRDLPPTLSRMKPGRSGVEKMTKEEIPLAELEAEADRIRELRHTFEDFLRILEGRARTVPDLEIVSLTDVYTLSGRVLTRDGPRAGEVPHWRAH